MKVTNAGVNVMVGSRQSGATVRYTLTTSIPYKANSPLLALGMLRPVRIYFLSMKERGDSSFLNCAMAGATTESEATLEK
jgi:hypothetical protein